MLQTGGLASDTGLDALYGPLILRAPATVGAPYGPECIEL